jgi:hypothetical protein
MGIGGKKKRPRKINFGGRASWSGARGKHTYTTFFSNIHSFIHSGILGYKTPSGGTPSHMYLPIGEPNTDRANTCGSLFETLFS